MKTNVFNSKRILSLFLALVMVFSMMPMTALPAFAVDTTPSADKAIMPGTSGISGYDSTNGYDHIYMGYWTAMDSNTTSGAIKWRVLDDQTNTGGSGLFLLSDVLLGTGGNYGDVYFDNSGRESNVWQGSTAQAWCKDFAGEEGAVTNMTDAFTAGELGAVLATTKSDQAFTSSTYSEPFSASENILNGDRVFFLSAEEVENSAYGFTDDNARAAYYGTYPGTWWLRSPKATNPISAGVVCAGEASVDANMVDIDNAARPAFNLDLNAVLFTSAAVGGKQGTTGTIAEISTSNVTEWKLTLKDSSRSGFTAQTTGKNGDTLTVSYSGATTGANEYISVMIADSTGAYTHYGRIKNITEDTNASGTVEIDLSGIDMTGKTLYVFNEQYNGGANDDTKLTDYASSFVNVPLAVTGIIDVSILSSDLIITDTGYSMNGNSYLYEGNYTLTGTTSHGVIFEAGDYQLTANDLSIVRENIWGHCAVTLAEGAELQLVLADGSENTLTGGQEGCGIWVKEGASLIISGNGTLHAGYQQGGNAAFGAAIGGRQDENFGTITINGGTIYATGTRGASIGSGNLYNTSNTMAGTIVLNGGTIYADLIGNAKSSGAVLKGSGATVYCDSVRADTSEFNTIVYSKDGASATYYCNDFIVTGDIANCSWNQTNKVLNINGGTVTVSNTDKNAATSQRIYIQGTANVTLNGVNISSTTGAPIEIRDYNDTNVNLTLRGSNTLISQTANKAAIHKTRGQQATSSDAATLTINGSGSLTAVGGNNAAGIGGGGHRGDTHNIIINSGTISATGKGWAAGIGSSNDGSTWNITINGGNITASGAPGIGANTDNWQGVKDASITGGMVTTNSYKGSTPTGGLVSTDGGKTFTVYSDYTLSQDLTIATDGKLTVAEGTKLIIADGFTLTNKGVIVNDGTISGNLVNEGTIYNKGTLPANVGGTVYEQYVKVNNGSGTGNYTEGSTVTITADAPASGMMFTGWTIELGTITLTDSAKAETTFTMPEGCVIVKANYADIVATITDSNGNVQYYSDGFRAQEDWTRNGGTLTVHSDDFRLEHMDAPDGSVLDLNGHSVEPMMLHIRNSCTIQNGTISMWHEGIVEEDAVVTFKNVTITNDEHGSWEVEITNDGTIIDEGLTLNGVIISGGPVKTGLTEDRVTLSNIPTEGYVYDGTAQEPGVKCGETTLVAGIDYTVTFSNSSGGDSTVNAGTITMTITGIGNYAGTVTKTYTITDTTAPTGTILIKENSWREFWNWISFGLFCKDHVDVTITADGTGSNVTKVEYLLSNTVMEENNIPNDGWTALTKDGNAYKFRIQPKSKVAVYVRITDEGGNVTIINSDGIVVYEDSKAIDTEVTYTYKENSNKDIAVEFNGNTVKSITCGEKVLAANTDYSVDYESGKIVLKSTYLDTLNAGDYTFTVSYNPMGFENSGVTDLTTTFTVKVEPTSIAGATVTVNGTFTYDGNAKTPDPVVVLNGETLVKDRDYSVSYTENVNAGTATVTVTGKGNYNGTASGEYEITKREITIIVDAKNTVVNTTLPTYTYKVEGLVGVDALVTEPTLTCNANIAVIGEYDITASGADAGGNYSIKYVPAKLTVLTDNVVDVAAGYTEELKDYDPATVTSEDKDELQDMLDEINTILGDETITTNGKNAMEEVKKQVEKLIKEITDAAEATDTENTEKVEDVTAENVTPDNKTDLEKAKADLEKALDEHDNNMTEDEKKAIEDELKRIDDALKVIENVEAVENAISDLPATVEPDDEETVAKIEAAKKSYNELTDYEKSLVDPETKEKLDKLTNGIVAYDIVKGDGSSWAKGTDGSITFTVNGPISKFSGIKIDGKAVDAQYYDIKAGSTIITLKDSYLETLAAGEHSITVVYTDGETSGTFNVQAKSTTPATGDNSNMFLWIALLFVSGTGIFGITLYDRKRKTANK